LLQGVISSKDAGGLSGFSAGTIMAGFAALGIILFILATGLWLFRPWAWRLTMIVVGMLLIYGLWVEFSGGRSLSNGIGLLINIFIVFYLVQGDIRGLFVNEEAVVGQS
jgi:uncharacterized membrane protein (DUF2068 family)